MSTFGCTKYALEKARKMKATSPGIVAPEKKQYVRNRIDQTKTEHFITYLFSNGLIQDVAYGITKLKFENGFQQLIPHAVLTSKYGHVINSYLQFCKEISFQSLSERTLWRVLQAIKPSRRKSLAGLDDKTAEGMNGFDVLQDFAKNLMKNSSVCSGLEKGKRYLKTRYQINCMDETSKMSSHSTSFALSDPKESMFICAKSKEVGTETCQECFELIQNIQSVHDTVKRVGSPENVYDMEQAVAAVFEYVQHQMRDSQQKKAKTTCLDDMNDVSAFWLRDFAQKILPMKYREGQREYFGKKGMSLHIDIFFKKDKGVLVKSVYLTAVYRCDQDMKATLNIADVVLKEYKKDEPNVSALYVKSDNAGCYHGSLIPAATFKLCNENGFQLIRYDFNEPCKGKDQCDRESAAIKSILHSYVDSGNNILQAEDIHQALGGGAKLNNTKVVVIAIDSNNSVLTGDKIKNFPNFHSILFHEESMTLWRYFEIGKGMTRQYNNVSFKPSYDIIIPFTNRVTKTDTSKVLAKRIDRQLCTAMFCPEPGCTASFPDELQYEKHILEGKHKVASESSSMDSAKKIFADHMKIASKETFPRIGQNIKIADDSIENISTKYPLMKLFTKEGWSLPTRKMFRYSYKQKKLLYDYFMEGELSKKKLSPEQVAKLLRKDLAPEEYVSVQQIRSLFSRWSKQYREGSLKEPAENTSNVDVDLQENEQESDGEEINEEEYEDELEEVLENQMSNVLNDLSWKEDEWVAVRYGYQWFPGVVCEVFSFTVVVL